MEEKKKKEDGEQKKKKHLSLLDCICVSTEVLLRDIPVLVFLCPRCSLLSRGLRAATVA